MQKTIYVKDQAEWDLIKGRAESAGQTVSRYLLGGVSQLDRIEKKLDLLIPNAKAANPEKFESHKPIRDYSVGGKDEQTEIKVGFEDSGEKTIKEKKIDLVKDRDLSPKISKSDEAMLLSKMKGLGIKQPENFFNPMSKDRQLGKRKK